MSEYEHMKADYERLKKLERDKLESEELTSLRAQLDEAQRERDEADKRADGRWCAALELADWDGGVFHHDGRIYPWPRGFVPDCPATWDDKLREAQRQLAAAQRERDEWQELADRCEDVSSLKEKLAVAVAVLEWYADKLVVNAYDTVDSHYDGGNRAREALAEIRGTKERT